MPIPPATNPRLRIISWALFGLCCLPLVAWPLLAMMSPMLFDAPGSESNVSVLIVFFSVISYPLFALAGVLTGWRVKSNAGAVLRFALPLLDLAICAVTLSTWTAK